MRRIAASRALLFCLLIVLVGWSGSSPDDRPSSRRTALQPLAGDTDSAALSINDRGFVAGNSSGPAGTTAVVWTPEGTAMALSPLDGDQESFAVAINNSRQVVGHSVDNGGICPVQTAVMWDRQGAPHALLPLDGGEQSVAQGINDAGGVVGTSKGLRADPEASCESLFTPVVWGEDAAPTALAPLEGFPEGYAIGIASNGDIVGGSVNVITGFDFQGTVWRGRQHNTRPLRGPADGFLNTTGGGNDSGMVVGDSFDSGFASRAVIWNSDGDAILLPPLNKLPQSSGRAINARGLAVGMSMGDGTTIATIWDRRGRPKSLRPLSGDTDSEAMAINRSGQVAGTSSGSGVSTAVVWTTRQP